MRSFESIRNPVATAERSLEGAWQTLRVREQVTLPIRQTTTMLQTEIYWEAIALTDQIHIFGIYRRGLVRPELL